MLQTVEVFTACQNSNAVKIEYKKIQKYDTKEYIKSPTILCHISDNLWYNGSLGINKCEY